ncbi:3-dehydroquinate synthase [Bacillus sp. RAR_GA_16]|uniref:3-dehydroquinate synthase n=1 Tax=Bacillus sp. RAR_GA_16 TaxID=2876774 RepID=UPI001CCB6BC5|nr:3-dehydroquinate synthase [Bacillus sp. RAR_GA_16]MCA0172081.1 3-dehydroquinate synthase [Bacillus sp. RAR_GA_16]
MNRLSIDTSSGSYSVYIGTGIRNKWRELVDYASYSSFFIITDEAVAARYLPSIQGHENIPTFVAPSGEGSKSFPMYHQVMTALLEAELDRKACIIALGGGVVGDLAGFAAATYMRGIDFIQIPTTLLAHDSSVGGKTGINHEVGKNLIGAFHQPSAVIFDTECLRTLPGREWRSGFSEVIKHALIHDESFLNWLMQRGKPVQDYTDEELQFIIKKGISVKGAIVKEDEREKGIRAYLNFGHTLGHAIESELGYGKMTHGEAVAIGMIYALKLSEEYFQTTFRMDEITKWFQEIGLPTKVPKELRANKLIDRMKKDKKAENKTLQFVLLKKIGQPVKVTVEDDSALELLRSCIEGSGTH